VTLCRSSFSPKIFSFCVLLCHKPSSPDDALSVLLTYRPRHLEPDSSLGCRCWEVDVRQAAFAFGLQRDERVAPRGTLHRQPHHLVPLTRIHLLIATPTASSSASLPPATALDPDSAAGAELTRWKAEACERLLESRFKVAHSSSSSHHLRPSRVRDRVRLYGTFYPHPACFVR
jgi:hypothetical protein